LYLSEDSNVTNRELVRLQENLTFIQKDLRDYSKEVEKVEKNVENLDFKIELALSLISIAIIDIVVRFFLAVRSRKDRSEDK
jgi:predicted  nucleic acid-binding Zn-ribbon protein